MRFAFAFAPLLLVAACTAEAPPASLVSITPIAAGTACPAGGTAIATGDDDDGDGTLDADEVEQTQVVCRGADGQKGNDGKDGQSGSDGQKGGDGKDGEKGGDGKDGEKGGDGQNGLTPLVRLDVEPRGTHCAGGGTAVKSGLDSDRNGVLADREVTATQYVCSGDGTNPAPLVRVGDEPAGAHCAAGGTAIRIGSDLDGDHVLDDAEITDTQYLCRAQSPAVVVGHLLVHNSLEAAALIGVREVTGDVVVDVPGLDAVDLHALERIGGRLELRGLDVLALDLPALTSVGGGVVIADNQSAHLAAPVLTSIGGELSITGSPGLAVALPVLATVHGNLSLDGPHLEAASLPKLATLDGSVSIVLANGTLALPGLTAFTSVSVASSDLAALALPNMAEVTLGIADSHIGAVTLTAATTARGFNIARSTVDAVSAPALTAVTGLLGITNSIVSAVAMGKLTSIGEVFAFGLIVDNSRLLGFPWRQLRTVGGGLWITGSAGLDDLTFSELITTSSINIVDNDLTGKRITLPKWTRGEPVSVGVMIRNNDAIEVSLPKVDVAGNLVIDEGHVTTVHLEALASAQLLEIVNTETLLALSLPALRSVGNLLIDNNRALTTLGAGGLEHSQQVNVTNNLALRGLGLGALGDGFVVQVHGNPHVPSCEAQALAERIHASTVVVHDNDEGATCP